MTAGDLYRCGKSSHVRGIRVKLCRIFNDKRHLSISTVRSNNTKI